MTRVNSHLVGKHKKFLVYVFDQAIEIAAGKICSANRVIKQNITTDQELLFRLIKAHMAGRVTWEKQNPERTGAKVYDATFC